MSAETASAASVVMSASDVWTDILAPKFIRYRGILVAGAKPHGHRAMTLFGPRARDRVLDVGCGFGDATLELVDRVGRSGFATGLDVVPAFVDLARELARERGASNVRFTAGDAETFEPRAAFDYLFARFGTMFFERPLAAFRNLHAMLAPEGRLVMTTWRTIEENPWLGVARDVARMYLPPPAEEAVSCGPGPFSLAEPELVRELLSHAGFHHVTFVTSDAATLVGTTLDEAIEFQLALGPAGEIVREAGPAGARALPELRKALRTALAPFDTGEGVRMASAAFIVHARA